MSASTLNFICQTTANSDTLNSATPRGGSIVKSGDTHHSGPARVGIDWTNVECTILGYGLLASGQRIYGQKILGVSGVDKISWTIRLLDV